MALSNFFLSLPPLNQLQKIHKTGFFASSVQCILWILLPKLRGQKREKYLLRTNYWTENHWMPSTSGWARSKSGLLLMIMAALPLIRVRDILWNNCLIAMFSSIPWCRDKAAPILVCSTATLWKPPRVSRAKGRKEIPWSWQAWAAPSTLRLKAFSSAKCDWNKYYCCQGVFHWASLSL